MQNRESNKVSTSRKSFSQLNLFYTKEGKLKEQFLPLCQELKIDPSELYLKSPNDFSGPEVSEKVQTQRFNGYESKRLCKLFPSFSILEIFPYNVEYLLFSKA